MTRTATFKAVEGDSFSFSDDGEGLVVVVAAGIAMRNIPSVSRPRLLKLPAAPSGHGPSRPGARTVPLPVGKFEAAAGFLL